MIDFGLLAGSALLALAAVVIGIRACAALAGDASDRRFLRAIFAAALLLRLGLAVVTYIKFPYGYFAPDEAGSVGAASDYLNVVSFISPTTHGQGWTFFNILVLHIFGTEPLLPRFWNCLVGAVTPLLGFALAREFGAVRGARWSAILIAFFPSTVLWSTLNLHDVNAYCLILLAFVLTIRLQESPRWWKVVALALTLFAMYLLRIFSDAALFAAVACGVLAPRLRIPGRYFVRISLVTAAAIVCTAVGAVVFPRPGQYLYTRLGVSQIAHYRRSLASGARSAVDVDPGLQTLVGAIAFLPFALVDFLLRPFPWERGSSLSILTRPETILYYALLPLVAVGIFLAVRKAALRTVPSLVFLVITALGYAMVLSNLGTIYRERGELIIVMFTFVGLAVDAIAALRWPQRGSTNKSTALDPVQPAAPPSAGGSHRYTTLP
jgi:hypothetical protein